MTIVQKNNHIKSLDGVRGLAVILVFLNHWNLQRFTGGWIGVDIFFLLSGYLITSLIQLEYRKTGDISFKNFYMRRMLRLYPALIICVIIANILWSFNEPFIGGPADRLIATFSSIFYFNNLVVGSVNGNLGHLWSLSVEEHFYILWPLLMYLLFLKMPLKKILISLSVIILLVWIWRIYVYNCNPTPIAIYGNKLVINAYLFTFCRIDSILLGALISFYYFKNKSDLFVFSNRINHVVFGILLLLLFIITLTIDNEGVLMKHGFFILTNLVCFSLIIFALNNPDYYLLSNQFIRWFGSRSYGIYLYHFPVFMLIYKLKIIDHYRFSFFWLTILRLGISMALAEISYRCMETPVLKLKEKFNSH